VALGNIGGLIRRIRIRRKNSQVSDESNSSNISSSKPKVKLSVILGIAMSVIGFAGAIYFGSQFVKEEVNAGGTLPYTFRLISKVYYLLTWK